MKVPESPLLPQQLVVQSGSRNADNIFRASRSDSKSQSLASSPGARVLEGGRVAPSCSASERPSLALRPQFPHMWEEDMSPVVPNSLAAWALCDGGLVNGYWPQASSVARALSLVIASLLGFCQKASSYNYWHVPYALEVLKIFFLI